MKLLSFYFGGEGCVPKAQKEGKIERSRYKKGQVLKLLAFRGPPVTGRGSQAFTDVDKI